MKWEQMYEMTEKKPGEWGEENFRNAREIDLFLDLLDLFYQGERKIQRAIGSYEEEGLLILFQNW